MNKNIKRILALVLALTAAVALAACGAESQKDAPDLEGFYEDYMASLSEAPMMMDVTDDLVETFYPGLGSISLKQSVLKTAAISAVAYEMALVECADSADVETVRDIFQARIDSQVEGGAMYPATAEAWEGAEILTSGNVVALIVAGQDQDAAVSAFNGALEG
mgnify:CR=1 FL=1